MVCFWTHEEWLAKVEDEADTLKERDEAF